MRTKKFFGLVALTALVPLAALIFKSKISQATAIPAPTANAGINAGSQSASSAPLTITADDLIKAGFSGVKRETAQANGRFSGSVPYFEVSDKVTDPTSEAPNIVMVDDSLAGAGAINYTYGSDSHAFSIAGGQGKEGAMFDGRVTVSFVKNGHYDVIMGPNRQKIEALANLMAQKVQ